MEPLGSSTTAIERATRRAVWATSAGGGLGALIALAALGERAGGDVVAALLALLLARLGWSERFGARDDPSGPWAQAARLALQAALAAGTAVAAGSGLALAPTLLLWVLAVLARRADRDAVAAAGMATAVLAAWLAREAAPSAPTLALVVAVALLAVVGLALIDSRATARIPLRLPRAAGGRPDEAPRQVARRVATAVALGLGVLLVTLALQQLGSGFATLIGPDARGGGPDVGAAGGGGGVEASAATRRELRGSVRYGGSLGGLGEDVVVEVRVTPRGAAGPRRVGPALRLAALHLDRFTAEGIESAVTAELVRDGDDGRDDGWIALEPSLEWDRTVEVTAVPIATGAASRAPLLHVDPLVAVQLPTARYHERGLLTTASPATGILAYRTRSAPAADPAAALRDGRAGPDRDALQLPPEGPALEFLRTRARAVVGDAATAGAKVAAVLGHFARGYRYSFVGSDEEGLDGLVDFVRRREGFCTSYASTAVLFLRLAGVPARVVTGYLVDEYDEARAGYVGRDSDAHAWFEVQFEGYGWVAFDATPFEALAAARAGDERGPGVGDWWTAMRDELRAWRAGGALAEPLAQLAGLPAALGVTLLRGGRWVVAALVALGVLALLWQRRRRAAGANGAHGAPGGARAAAAGTDDWYRALVRELARLGRPRPAAATPLEHARGLVREDFDEAPAVAASIDALYRERFARRALDEGERRAIDALLERLRARAAGHRSGARP